MTGKSAKAKGVSINKIITKTSIFPQSLGPTQNLFPDREKSSTQQSIRYEISRNKH